VRRAGKVADGIGGSEGSCGGQVLAAAGRGSRPGDGGDGGRWGGVAARPGGGGDGRSSRRGQEVAATEGFSGRWGGQGGPGLVIPCREME
jgi:translation initiation factor IF-2